MTTIEQELLPPTRRLLPARLLGKLTNLARAWHERAQRPATRLSASDIRMLYDLGIEPQDVVDALERRRNSLLFMPMRTRPGHE